jgi:hypothetical protein
METCDQAVMDFLAATDIGKFLPKWITGDWRGGLLSLPFFFFPLSGELLGTVSLLFFLFVSGDEGYLCHLDRLARRRRAIWFCHTLVKVNTVWIKQTKTKPTHSTMYTRLTYQAAVIKYFVTRRRLSWVPKDNH